MLLQRHHFSAAEGIIMTSPAVQQRLKRQMLGTELHSLSNLL